MTLIIENTIAKTFLRRVSTFPQKVAISAKLPHGPNPKRMQSFTFQEFYDQCLELSCGLRELGVSPGSFVILISKTRLEWSMFDWAILGCGAITVPIHPTFSNADFTHIFKQTEAKFAILENPYSLDSVPDIKKSLKEMIVIDTGPRFTPSHVSLSALRELGKRRMNDFGKMFDTTLESLKPNDLLTLCYTSGTTGKPKGVMITHENMMSVLEDCAEAFSPTLDLSQQKILTYLPASHILGRVESMALFSFGWHQVFAESMDTIRKNLQETKPTLLFGVPWIFQKFYTEFLNESSASPKLLRNWRKKAFQVSETFSCDSPVFRHSPVVSGVVLGLQNLIFHGFRSQFGGKLRAVISGGAPIPTDIIKFFYAIGIQFYEGYGLTETCGPITLNTPKNFKLGTVGRPLGEVSIKISDQGQVFVLSKKVSPGYFKEDSETSQESHISTNKWFATGDIGSIDSEGFLILSDRLKDLIILSTGENIAPQKIENIARSIDWIQHIFVYGDNQPYVIALITLTQDRVLSFASQNEILYSSYSELVKNLRILSYVQNLVETMNQNLGKHEQIKKFMILPEDFSVSKGEVSIFSKLRRNEIIQRYKKEIDRMYS